MRTQLEGISRSCGFGVPDGFGEALGEIEEDTETVALGDGEVGPDGEALDAAQAARAASPTAGAARRAAQPMEFTPTLPTKLLLRVILEPGRPGAYVRKDMPVPGFSHLLRDSRPGSLYSAG
jgi:hypothetical protein